MGLFSLCCGGAGTAKHEEEQSPLWAPLPGERRKGGSAGLAFGQGALRYDPFASAYDAQKKSARPKSNQSAPDPLLVLPSDDPFAPSHTAAGGWAAEPGYLREQAILAAQEAGANSPPPGKAYRFGLGRSRSPSPPAPAPLQPSRTRQRQPAGQQRAPAFGEGALTKWH